jgi:cobalt-precorrin 5A hydrolase
MKLAIVAINKRGGRIAEKLKKHFPGTDIYGKRKNDLKGMCLLKAATGKIFDKKKYDGIIFIAASGIAVRAIAPFIRNKYDDPAVVCVDTAGRFAISLLCGHEGGANKLAVEVSNILYAEPVITTGSEAKKKIVIGIGCRRNTKKGEIVKAIQYALAKAKTSLANVKFIATIDLKKNEPGLKKACSELGILLRIIPAEAIRNFKGSYHRSSFVKEKIGVEGVSEPCALLAARNSKLLLPKIKAGRVTVAIARENSV